MKIAKRIICFTIASVGLCGQSQAAELYTSEDSFSDQVIATRLIDFNAPSSQRSFNAFPLVIDGLSLSVNLPGYNGSGNSLTGENDELNYYSIDGTQFAAIDLVRGATFTLTFGGQTQGFGASFVGLANNGRTEVIKLLKADGSLIESFTYNGSVAGGLEPSFLGFTSEIPFFAGRLHFSWRRCPLSASDGQDCLRLKPPRFSVAYGSLVYGLATPFYGRSTRPGSKCLAKCSFFVLVVEQGDDDGHYHRRANCRVD